MKTIRVAVVGVGYLGALHAEKYAGLPGVELVAVVDVDRARALEIAGRFGVSAFTSHAELTGRVDAATVAAPTPEHHRITGDLLGAGIDVLVEKPIASSVEEAADLVGRAEEGGRILQVGHIERYNAAILALRDSIQSPMFIEAHRMAPFTERGTEVDVILDLMIHDIDIVQSFVTSPVSEVRAVGVPVISQNVDIANARLQFANGAVANITASRISAERSRKIRFFQRDAYISVDCADASARLFSRHPSSVPGGLPEISAEEKNPEKGDALMREVADFIDAVRSGRDPTVPGEDGLRAMETADRIVEEIQKYMAALQVQESATTTRKVDV